MGRGGEVETSGPPLFLRHKEGEKMYSDLKNEENAVSDDAAPERDESAVLPEGEVFTEGKLGVAAYLGGPLIAGYMISRNFKTLFNDDAKAKKTMVITVLSSVVIWIVIFSIPDSIDIPSFLFPAIYTSAAWGFMNYYQNKQIQRHIKNGGKKAGWGKTLLLSLLYVIIFVAMAVPIMILVETVTGN